jgi:hypothetical protein
MAAFNNAFCGSSGGHEASGGGEIWYSLLCYGLGPCAFSFDNDVVNYYYVSFDLWSMLLNLDKIHIWI